MASFIPSSSPPSSFLLFLFIFFLSLPSSSISSSSSSSSSYQYFYLTQHGGDKDGEINNVWKYDLKGNLVQKHILESGSPTSLRSLASNSEHPDYLYVAEANDSNSRIGLYGKCDSNGQRSYINDFVSSDNSNHIQHPYGLVFGYGSHGFSAFVSSQNINLVTSYNGHNGRYQQTLADISPHQIRGLAYHNRTGILYYADKDANKMVAYNTFTNTIDLSRTLSANDPISMFIDDSTDMAYVSENGNDCVSVYDLTRNTLIVQLTDKQLKHPAGSTVIGDSLYVVSQKQYGVMQFDIKTWKSKGLIIQNLDDAPEQLLRTNC